MSIERKEEGIITVDAGSALETSEAFTTTMQELGKIYGDKYNKRVNPLSAIPIPLGKTNSLFAILFYNIMDIAKYGVLPYSKKLADAGMMGDRCFVTGSDGELYKLKSGGQAGVDPAKDDGSNWDVYLSKKKVLELHKPSNIVAGGFTLDFTIASDKNTPMFTVTEEGLYTFNIMYMQDVAQAGDDKIHYHINSAVVAISPSLHVLTALRNKLIITTFTVYCSVGDVLACSGFNTSIKDFRNVTQSYSYIK